jgi:hypothetical protein
VKLFLGGLGCSHFHGFDPPLQLQHILSQGLHNAHTTHDVKQHNAEELCVIMMFNVVSTET